MDIDGDSNGVSVKPEDASWVYERGLRGIMLYVLLWEYSLTTFWPSDYLTEKHGYYWITATALGIL